MKKIVLTIILSSFLSLIAVAEDKTMQNANPDAPLMSEKHMMNASPDAPLMSGKHMMSGSMDDSQKSTHSGGISSSQQNKSSEEPIDIQHINK